MLEATTGGVLPILWKLGLILEAGTAKSGYIAILIEDTFG